MRRAAVGAVLAGFLMAGFAGTADAQSRKARLVRDGSPAELQRKAKRQASRPEHVRVARRECVRYRGWGDQYGQCLARYGVRG